MYVRSEVAPRLGSVQPKTNRVIVHCPLWNDHPPTRRSVSCEIGTFQQRIERFGFNLNEFSQTIHKIPAFNAQLKDVAAIMLYS